jgi:hypothetical protein
MDRFRSLDHGAKAELKLISGIQKPQLSKFRFISKRNNLLKSGLGETDPNLPNLQQNLCRFKSQILPEASILESADAPKPVNNMTGEQPK